VKDQRFPGAVAVVGDASGVLYQAAVGNYTYGLSPPYWPPSLSGADHIASPPMSYSTMFDMASCTKVMSTTSVVAKLYQDGFLYLETPISDESLLGETYSQAGKEDISVLNCLLHNAGFPPDPNPNYWFESFGCPETSNPQPAENFSCRDKIFSSVLSQTLENPVGAKYVYSDLSMITLMFASGHVIYSNRNHYSLSTDDLLPSCITARQHEEMPVDGGNEAEYYQCYYEAFARKVVFGGLRFDFTGFLPQRFWWGLAAPAEDDTAYLHRVIQGQVSDGNAYALGGIAGHAGLFSNIADISLFMDAYMFHHSPYFLNATTTALFTKEYNHTQSSRALGWNTNDPSVFDQGWNKSCGNLSDTTFMHDGYTGTMICGDPERQLYAVLLTNRVYPKADHGIGISRQRWTTAVAHIYDTQQPSPEKGVDNSMCFYFVLFLFHYFAISVSCFFICSFLFGVSLVLMLHINSCMFSPPSSHLSSCVSCSLHVTCSPRHPFPLPSLPPVCEALGQ